MPKDQIKFSIMVMITWSDIIYQGSTNVNLNWSASYMIYESDWFFLLNLLISFLFCWRTLFMNSMKTCPSDTFYFMKISFSDIDRKWILPNMIRAVNQSQFTPKMKANAVSRLLSSLVWIDQYNECNWLTTLIIFGPPP